MNDKRRSPVFNIIMWAGLFLGQGVQVCLYCQEWYAQIRCPRTGVRKTNDAMIHTCIKGIVHPKMKNSIIVYSPPCRWKVWCPLLHCKVHHQCLCLLNIGAEPFVMSRIVLGGPPHKMSTEGIYTFCNEFEKTCFWCQTLHMHHSPQWSSNLKL